MYYSIKKYQKKLMAVFAVLLMVSFLATLGVRGPSGGRRGDVVVAHIGETAIYNGEMDNAKEEWSWLTRIGTSSPLGFVIGRLTVGTDILLYSMIERPPMPESQDDIGWLFGQAHGSPHTRFQVWAAQYLQQPNPQIPSRLQQAQMLVSEIFQNIQQHSELFYLLRHEAEENGYAVSPASDQVNEYLRNVLDIDPQTVEPDALSRLSVASMFTVAGELQSLGSATKVSQPEWRHSAAVRQLVRLDLIDFRAADYLRSVPAPTTQQVQEQFNTFKDVAPGDSTKANPLGFGYQIPTRVKLQYLTIPRAQVIDAAVHTMLPPNTTGDTSDAYYQWTVAAATYYDEHKEEYKNEPPLTQPATKPAATQASATQPATQSVALTQPTSLPAIKPFSEVEKEIIEKLAADPADALAKKISDELSTRLAGDFKIIHDADPAAVVPTTAPTTAPAVASAAELMMLAHLEQIRSDIQQKYHVAVELHDIGSDWQTTKELAKLPGIGDSTTGDHDPFADVATGFAPIAPTGLQIWQPSQPLTDSNKNTYLFRLTAAQPAHAPADLASIAKKVTGDWKLAQAYQQAQQAGQKALKTAKDSGLSQAARASQQNVLTTPLFPPTRADQVPGYPSLDPVSTHELLGATIDVLRAATPTETHPDSLVELPAAQRIVVMELAGVQLPAPEWEMQIMAQMSEQQQRMMAFAAEWFSYENVIARTGYKAAEKPT